MTHLALILTAALLVLAGDLPAAGLAFGTPALASAPPWTGVPLLAAVALPKALVLAWFLWRGRVAAAHLGGPHTRRAVSWFNRSTWALPLIATALFTGDLWLGLLTQTRATLGNPVLLDELLAWAPTLLLLLAGPAARYHVERRIRESEIIRRADRGLPIHPMPRAAAWIIGRARQDLGLLLLPLLLLMAWGEALALLAEHNLITPTLGLCLGPAGALGVLTLAPFILRHTLDTVPLPPGPLRDQLLAQCTRHRVRVRELLIWRTHGTALNAAVTGLVPRLRYILLTDALIEELAPPQLHAVMEHELNHVRHRHLPTLLLTAAALLTAVAAASEAVARALAALMPTGRSLWLDAPLLLLGAGLWIAAFGWASRRIERQADTPRPAPPAEHFSAAHILPMLSALGQVGAHPHTARNRFNWRHGSIAWRQTYLRDLVGTPTTNTPIHRTVRHIRLAAALLLTTSLAALWWLGF